MCICNPQIRTPWCGGPGCEPPYGWSSATVANGPMTVDEALLYVDNIALNDRRRSDHALRVMAAEVRRLRGLPSLRVVDFKISQRQIALEGNSSCDYLNGMSEARRVIREMAGVDPFTGWAVDEATEQADVRDD